MNANTLFLRRVSQLRTLSESSDPIDLVDIASRIRQLIFDQQCLVDSVNNGLKLKFEVGTFRPGNGPDDDPHWTHVVYFSLQDGIDPDTSSHGNKITLARDKLGQHVIAYSNGTKITVKDIVKFNANKLGGTHFDPRPDADFQQFEALKSLSVGGLPAVSRELKAISRVIIKGLDPLTKMVESRVATIP